VAVHSAGLLPYRFQGERLEVLIGHMGGPYWASKDEHAWSIVKGELGEREDTYRAAVREFTEETGSPPPPGEPLALGEVKQSGGKTVSAWAIQAQLDPAAMRSNTFELEWPPRSGRTEAFPELDRFEWCPADLAVRRLVAAQAAFLERLQELLQRGGDAGSRSGD
jgi:predicted NUDIX family NTP pyrophosphohydrolase